MHNPRDLEIYETWMKTKNKTLTGQMFDVSPRTVGRVIEKFRTLHGDKPVHELEEAVRVSVQEALDRDDDGEVSTVEQEEVVQETPVQEELYKFYVVASGDIINVTRIRVDGSEPPESVISHRDSPTYERALAAYERGDMEGAFKEASVKTFIESFSDENIHVDVEKHTMYYKNGNIRVDLPARLAYRVIDNLQKNKSVASLVNFSKRLVRNPSKVALNGLYDFIEAADIEISEDGMVLCYKRINSQFRDCYTNSIDNSIGARPSVPRTMVDDNPENTCSYGLHVCSKGYLPHYGGDVVVLVEVDPADFVAVPPDYNKAKARVCEYHVLKDVTEEVR